MASVEQKKAYESVLRLVEEQKVATVYVWRSARVVSGDGNDRVESALLDMCTKCGRMTDAEEMFNSDSITQNSSIIWTSMICGYARNGNPYKALFLFFKGQSVSPLLQQQAWEAREEEEALKKELELEKKLDAKQKLEMEIEELKGKLQVMKQLQDDDDDTKVQEWIKKMKDEMEAKMEEMGDIVDMNQTLIVKERQRNDELQEARKELIKFLQDMPSGCTNICVKIMGEIDMKAFHDACKEKYDAEEAQIKASELCTLWQDRLKNPEWHPLKVVAVDGALKEVINEDDELLKGLKAEWGTGIVDAVVTACKEMNKLPQWKLCG